MAARPTPTPEPDSSRKNADSTATGGEFTKQPFLQSASKTPALQKHLHAVMTKRWLRVAGIVVAAVLVLCGRWLFWPFVPRYSPDAVGHDVAEDHRMWGRVAA